MSHLRPNDPESGLVKDVSTYTPEERIHVAVQIEDDHKNATVLGRKLDDKTLAFAHGIVKGTEKEGLVDVPKPALGLKN